MPTRGSDLLPPEARRVLADAGPLPAGERLVRYAEDLARADPGEARRWGGRLAHASLDDELLTACARWAGGVALFLSGDVRRAGPALEEAARRLGAAGHDPVADRVRLVLVDVLGERLEVGRARRLASRLQGRFTDRGDSERAAAVLVNLACAEDASDRIARARDLWRRARRDLPEGSLRRLLTDANLANVAALEGRSDQAAEVLARVAATARRERMPGLALQAELNLAEVEFAAGRVDDALSRWQRVVLEAESSDHPVVRVAAELDFAAAEASLGDLEGARTRVARALPLATELGLDREVVNAERLNAVLEAAAGARGAWTGVAERLLAGGLTAQRDLMLVDVAQLDPTIDPTTLARAARRLLRSGHSQRGRLGLAWAARRALDRGNRNRARRLAREVLEGRYVSTWSRMLAHHVLGRCGGPDRVKHLSLAVRHADRVHGRLSATADRQAFLTVRGDVYLDLLGALLERDRPRDRRRALEVAGRLRSGWLLDELARRADEDDDPLVRRWRELRARLATLLGEIEGDGEPRVRRSGLRLQRVIRSVEDELRRAEMDLARRWPLLAPGVRDEVVSGVARALPPDEVFIEYAYHRDDLVVFAVVRGRLSVRVVPGGQRAVADQLESVQFHLDAHSWLEAGLGAARGAALEDRLLALGGLLLDGVPIDDAARLWIAPHAGLVQVPWAALRHGSADPLVDRAPFTLVPGARAAAKLLQSCVEPAATAAISGTPTPGLPMVEREVRELARLVPHATVSESTTRDRFLELLQSHDLVHLAGHAVFLDGLPFASGLRLSDGFVTVRDLTASRLAARFVSFGVCSGLRLGRQTDDRYAGFVLALMNGGVRTVVGPVAPVRDDVAHAFDVALHGELAAAGDPGRAYRAAVRAVRDLDPSPATWGAFHVYGDIRSWRTT